MRYAEELRISPMEVPYVPGHWLTSCRVKWAWQEIERKQQSMKKT